MKEKKDMGNVYDNATKITELKTGKNKEKMLAEQNMVAVIIIIRHADWS